MGFLGNALAGLAAFAVATIAATGYWGVFFLMVAESTALPVPSEAVMPFAGYLAERGDFSVLGVLVVSSLGSLVGSAIGYAMGAYGALPLVERYGKYVLVGPHHVASAHRFFERRGALAILVCRFVPGVRHVVSIPAGAARMPLGSFFAATFIGATAWNAILLWAGYALGSRWEEFGQYKRWLDLAALGLLLALVLYVAYEWRKARRAER